VWVGIGLKKTYASDVHFHGETSDGAYSLEKAIAEARAYIEDLPAHVQWTNELVAASLGIEQPRASAEAEAAAA
jgi:hypothetical protein